MSALFFLAPRVPRSGKLAPALSKSWPELTRFVQRECTVNEWTLTILRHAQLHLPMRKWRSSSDLGENEDRLPRKYACSPTGRAISLRDAINGFAAPDDASLGASFIRSDRRFSQRRFHDNRRPGRHD